MPSRMRRLYYMSVTTVLAALRGSACSDPDVPEPIVPCSGKVAMSVALNDTTPRFDWTPRCGVTALDASSGPSSQLPSSSWRIEADSAVIVPPVTLGVVPARARSGGVLPLMSGLSYRVDLYVRAAGRPLEWVGNSGWQQP